MDLSQGRGRLLEQYVGELYFIISPRKNMKKRENIQGESHFTKRPGASASSPGGVLKLMMWNLEEEKTNRVQFLIEHRKTVAQVLQLKAEFGGFWSTFVLCSKSHTSDFYISVQYELKNLNLMDKCLYNVFFWAGPGKKGLHCTKQTNISASLYYEAAGKSNKTRS